MTDGQPFLLGLSHDGPGDDRGIRAVAIVYLIIFGFGFLASIYIYNDGARRYGTNAVKRRAMQRGSGVAMAVFGVGLFFFGIRILQISPFNFGMRIWLWICLLALIAMAGYFAYYFRTAYQAQLKDWQERQVKRQYMRPAHAGGTTVPARTAQGGSPQATIDVRRRDVRKMSFSHVSASHD